MSIKLELLAPAGNKSIGIAAINCGADAVYIAGPSFGARQAAGNSLKDIAELVCYAHLFGARVYLVVNTILYDSELNDAQKLITEAYNIGCDAIIIQDLGILQLELPDIPLYASTQTNIRTPEQAKFLESLGFERLILERGLSNQQIKAICDSTHCEIETFVHGALCTSYSGQCYLSRKLDGRSANRGSCIQACRSTYNLLDKNGKIIVENKALLSLKDFNLGTHIQELIDVGVTSFKIEGRLKNESFVKNTTLWYRHICDTIIDRSNGKYERQSLGQTIGGFAPNPNKTFNRGYTDFFFSGKKSQWSNMESSKSMGEKIGIVTNILQNNKNACKLKFKSNCTLSNGDGLCFLLDSGEIIGTRADKVENDTIFTKEIPSLKAGAGIWRNYDIKFEKEIENNSPSRLISVSIDFYSKNGNYIIKAISEKGIELTHTFTKEYDLAKNKELAIQNIANCFNKKQEYFQFSSKKIELEEAPFIPLSELNSIRREIANALKDKIQDLYTESKDSKLKKPISKIDFKNIIAPLQKEYLNCSNELSAALYKSIHINPEIAYDLKPIENSELMRTKYCILHELRMCHKLTEKRYNEPLFLENNKQKLRLVFDCKNCEMLVIG